MPLVKAGAIIADPYVFVAEGDLPEGAVLIPLARLQAEADTLDRRNAPIGVKVPNTTDVTALAPLLSRISLIALEFPKFRDGRAFSQARLLRERLGFSGELRATGNVLRDQLLLMARCGFDAFEVEKAEDAAHVAEAMSSYTIFYQPTGDGRGTVARARAAGA